MAQWTGRALNVTGGIVLLLALLFWLSSFTIKTAAESAPEPVAQVTPEPVAVRVRASQAVPYMRRLELQGKVEPRYSVDLRSELAARVIALPVVKGQRVEAGQVLLRLDPDAKAAQINEAEADLAYKQRDLTANRRLNVAGGSTQNDVMRLASEVASAKLALENARLALARTQPQAPFDGIIDQLSVDPGDYLGIGDSWGRLVDIDSLKVSAQAAQQDVSRLAPGQLVEVRLLDASRLQGRVTYIAYTADEQTRSYAVEAEVANPEGLRIAGASASLSIATGEVSAHTFPASLLTLDTQGRVGVMVVDDQDLVHFLPVTLLSVDTDTAWVGGLPDRVALITLGAGFAEQGQRVRPVPDEASTASAGGAE